VPSPLINDDLTLSHEHEYRLQQGDSEGPGKDEVVNEYVVKGRVKGRGNNHLRWLNSSSNTVYRLTIVVGVSYSSGVMTLDDVGVYLLCGRILDTG